MRLPGQSTELLSIDRENEVYNTKAAATTGIGPEVLEHVPGIDVMVAMFDMNRQFDQRTANSVFGSLEDGRKYFGIEQVYLFAANLEMGHQKEKLIARASDVVKTIAEGDRAGGPAKAKAAAKAKADLDRWVADLRAMQTRGALTEVTVNEEALVPVPPGPVTAIGPDFAPLGTVAEI